MWGVQYIVTPRVVIGTSLHCPSRTPPYRSNDSIGGTKKEETILLPLVPRQPQLKTLRIGLHC